MNTDNNPAAFDQLDEQTQQMLKAAAFDRLVAHFQNRTDVQNIDVMNLAGFCRNCLSKWLASAAEAHNIELNQSAAREHVYGMPYEAWKALHQKP